MPSERLHVIDSHTEGEPTRVLIDGLPDLGGGPLAARLETLKAKFDGYRTAMVCEPRGSDVLVGAFLLEPSDPRCAAAVVFCNPAGYLGMCGHGTIGLVTTLAHLGRIGKGEHLIETPVGIVRTTLYEDGSVSVRNVPCYRYLHNVSVCVPGHGELNGDVAYGGNWFFLSQDHGQEIAASNAEDLTGFSWKVRRALEAQGITGRDGAEIDHIELFGPSTAADSKSFVLCPGGAYDRSPCGTGTSAKLACLHADGKLRPGDVWRQESLIGSVFEGSIEVEGDAVIPTIRGRAHITAEATLILEESDPYRLGIVGL